MVKLLRIEAKKNVWGCSFVSREKIFMIRHSEDIREIDCGLFNDMKALWAEEISLSDLEDYAKAFEKMKPIQKKLETGVIYDARKRKEIEKRLWY